MKKIFDNLIDTASEQGDKIQVVFSISGSCNRRIDMVLLYNVASYRSSKGLYIFWGRIPPQLSREKSP